LPQHHAEVAAKDVESVEQINIVTRLRVAEMRIGKLERQIIELQSAPANVETDMLKQRLKVTESALAVAAERENSEATTELLSADRVFKPDAKPKTSVRMERGAPNLPPKSVNAPPSVPRLRLVDPKKFEFHR
jgi:hypothetical protein